MTMTIPHRFQGLGVSRGGLVVSLGALIAVACGGPTGREPAETDDETAVHQAAVRSRCTESTLRAAVRDDGRFDFATCDNPDGIVQVSATIPIQVSRFVLEGRGALRLVWSGGGTCDKTVGQPALFDIRGDDNVLRGFSVEGAPDGIHVSTGRRNRLEGLTYPFVCEDAITNGNKTAASATETLIKNCVFKKSDDKAIQSNGGSLRVEGCRFENVKRAIGACAEIADPGHHPVRPCPIASHITAVGNTVIGCSGYAFRSAGKRSRGAQGTLSAIGNTFVDCSGAIAAYEDGESYAEGNKHTGRCAATLKSVDRGELRYCRQTSVCDKLVDGSSSRVRASCR